MGLVTTYGVGQYSSGNAGEAHTAAWDRAYKTGGRGIIWAHLATGNSQYMDSQAGSLGLVAGLSGFGPIMAGDFAGDQWGSDTAQSRITDAWAWVKSAYGAKTDKAILVGVSMGGLNVLNWARANPTLVKAIILFYPVVNLQGQHDGTGGASGAFTASIETAYGGLAAFNAAVAAHDPAQHAASYTGVPIRMYYSTSDTTVGTANQTAFATAVGGSAFSSVSLGAATHADLTQPDLKDVAAWASTYA